MSVLAAGSAALTGLTLLADDGDVGDEAKKAGPLALLVIIVLCVACFLLFRSMSKHMRKVRDEFPTDTRSAGDDVSSGSTTVPAGTAGPGVTRATPKSRPAAPDDPASG